MDCLFNKQIPQESDKIVILPPISNTYDNTYNPKLRGRISEKEFEYIMNKLNEELMLMWPCCFCFFYGYVMSLFTLGLSFIFPGICVAQAKTSFLENIDKYNEDVFNKYKLHMTYKEKCSTSWLEIQILDENMNSEFLLSDKGEKINILVNNQLG